MTAILAICSRDVTMHAVDSVQRMLSAMSARGADWQTSTSRPGLTVAQAGHRWGAEAAMPDSSRLYADDTVICVADATLYYRETLARKLNLGAAAAAAMSCAQLIAMAYAVHGDEMEGVLEGDFAFVLWDAARQRLRAARDFAGHRALYFHATPQHVVIASSVGAVLAHAGISRKVDLTTVAEAAACLSRHSNRTCYEDVREIHAGHVFCWQPGAEPVISRYWNLPVEEPAPRDSLPGAAARLRELLTESVRERLDTTGSTCINLSGGWDSTAVYGIAKHLLRGSSGSTRLKPISMSYPAGDRGREDELINEALDFWRDSGVWEDIGDVDLFDGNPFIAARRRDDAVGHHFESWNRRLFGRAAALGGRVTWTGAGGDQLFHISGVYLSDLVRKGQVFEAARQFRARGGRGYREFIKLAMVPIMPRAAFDLLHTLGGPALSSTLERQPPLYFRREYVRANRLDTRDRETQPAFPAGSAIHRQMQAGLLFPHVGRTMGHLFQTGLESGVEVRHPLLDERVVRFAATRPWNEKADGRETKVLLRGAVAGLLPESVLAPRASRTGQSGSFFVSQMRTRGYELGREVAVNAALCDLQIVDPAELAKAWEYFQRTGDDNLAFQLYHTLQAELWLRQNG